MHKLLQMEGHQACVAFRFLRYADVRVVLVIPEAASEKNLHIAEENDVANFCVCFWQMA